MLGAKTLGLSARDLHWRNHKKKKKEWREQQYKNACHFTDGSSSTQIGRGAAESFRTLLESNMIKKKFSTPFHCFPTIPILSLPGGPGDVPIVSDQNTVGWYSGLHRLVDIQ